MKNAILFAAALAVSSVPLVAQQVTAAAEQNSTTSAAGVNASQSASADAKTGSGSVQANGSASANAEMRPINTELVGKLDSKSAKAGDSVVVKTNEKVRTAEGLVIPKGSRLIGHVTGVEAHGSGHADSSMSILFDQAELKGGQSVAIHSVIETVTPPANAVAAGTVDGDDSIAAPISGGARGGGGGRVGGGLLGGTAGTAGSVAGGATSNLGAATGSAVHATTGIAAEATSGVGGGLRESTGAAGALGAHATGIPGVMLAGDATGSASGTLTASRKNIHLDSGTQIVLGLSAAAMGK